MPREKQRITERHWRNNANHVVAPGKEHDRSGDERSAKNGGWRSRARTIHPISAEQEKQDRKERRQEVAAPVDRASDPDTEKNIDERHAHTLAQLKVQVVRHVLIAEDQLRPWNSAVEY